MTIALANPAMCREVAGVSLQMATAETAGEAALPVRGRTIVWRHLEQPPSCFDVADEAQRWAAGTIDLLIVSGAGSRALAVAARDAGLQLSQVVVCRERTLATDLILRQAAPGDAVVLVDADDDAYEHLSAEIAVRWGTALSAGPTAWSMTVAA